MDYKLSWYELKKWIETSISHLTILMNEMSEKEHSRLKSKREGFMVIYQYMLESEKIYRNHEDELDGNEEDELDEKLQEMTANEMKEFFDQIDENRIIKNLLENFDKK